MSWSLVKSYATAQAIADGITAGELGAVSAPGDYGVSGGVFRRNAITSSLINPVVYNAVSALRTKVELDLAPISKQAAAGSGDQFHAYGCAHETTNGDQGLCGGVRFYTGGSELFAGFHNSGASAGNTTATTTTNGATPTVAFEVTSANGTSSSTLASLGGSTRADTGRTSAPLAGKPGFFLFGSSDARSNNGITALRIYEWVADPTPVITSATTASGTTGQAFSYTITADNSPTSYNATGLPAGLSVNTSTGVISGTPSASGTSSVTISATNETGTDTETLTITINPASYTMTISPAVTDTYARRQGTTVSCTITGVGSTWTTSAPSLSVSGLTGGSISSVVVNSNTSVTFALSLGSTGNVATITDATTGGVATLLVGGPITSSGDGSNITLSIPDFAGVSGVTYQWYTSGTNPQGAMSAISGQTSRTAAIAAADNAMRYFVVDVTYGGTTRRIAEGFANTGGTVYWIKGASRRLPSVPTFSAGNRSAVRVACIGDSITSTTVTNAFKAALDTATGQTTTRVHLNRGGTTYADWQKTAAPFGGDSTNLFAQLIAAITAAGGVDHITIGLGSNDGSTGRSLAATVADVNALITSLKSDLPGIKIHLECPIYRVGVGDLHAFITGIVPQLQAIADADSSVYMGVTTEGIEYFAAHAIDQTVDGGTHPDTTGSTALGQFWAEAFLDATASSIPLGNFFCV